MEPFSLSSCMCMTQHTPVFPAGCLSRARPGRGRGCSDPSKPFGVGVMSPKAPHVLPDLPWAPRAQPRGRAAAPWCATALWTWHRYGFIFAASQHRERMSFLQFHRLGSKEGKGKLKHLRLWGQCNQAYQRFLIFQSFMTVFSALQLS